MKRIFYPSSVFSLAPSFFDIGHELNDLFKGTEGWNAPRSFDAPHFKETEQGYLLSIDIPGIKKEDISIDVEDETLKISGVRKNKFSSEETKKDEEFKLESKFRLPSDVDADKISAYTEDGVLYLHLSKAEKARPKKVEITLGRPENLISA